jgi:hypothetical protein
MSYALRIWAVILPTVGTLETSTEYADAIVDLVVEDVFLPALSALNDLWHYHLSLLVAFFSP